MRWPIGQILGRLCAAEPPGKLTDIQLVHLIFESTQRNSKVLCSRRHVPSALLERAKDEVPLERVGGVLEQAVPVGASRLELGEVELERQVLFRHEVLVAHRDQALD